MAAVYLVTRMDAGNLRWRSEYTEDLSGDGPEDKTLIIKLRGNRGELAWLLDTPQGLVIDLDELRKEKPDIFDHKWLSNKGLVPATLARGLSGATITVHLG